MAAILYVISWVNESYARNEALFHGVMEKSPNGIWCWPDGHCAFLIHKGTVFIGSAESAKKLQEIVGNQWWHTHVRITQDVRIISDLKQRFKDASSHAQNNWSSVELRVLALKDREKTLCNRGQIKEAQIIYDTILGMLTPYAQNETCKGLLAIIIAIWLCVQDWMKIGVLRLFLCVQH
eukprot:536020_1